MCSVGDHILNDEQVNRISLRVPTGGAPFGQKRSGIVAKSFIGKDHLDNHKSLLVVYRMNKFNLGFAELSR